MTMSLISRVVDSLRPQLSAPWLQIVLAFAAIACGALIGTERERHDKPAGLRTLILVCLGAAVYTMVSFVFTTPQGDSGRVAAQIVTGVGFLGAGAIVHGGRLVSGMTTAAAVWMTAAIGIVAGAGYAVPALGTAVLVRLVLVWVEKWEIRHLGGMRTVDAEVTFDPAGGKTRLRLQYLLGQYRGIADSFSVEEASGGLRRVSLRLRLPRKHLNEFLFAVTELPEVRAIDCRESGGGGTGISGPPGR